MPESVDELGATAIRAARDVRVGVGRLRRRLRDLQDREEVTASQMSVLGRLDRAGPMSVTEIAALEGVRHQSVALWVGALAERGLVDRTPDPADGRRQVISVSPAGHAFLTSKRTESEHWLARALQEQLTDGELDTVVEAMALLERVISR